MNKVNCYWIIDVSSGRKSGYSFAVKTLESEEDWPCDSSRYIEILLRPLARLAFLTTRTMHMVVVSKVRSPRMT